MCEKVSWPLKFKFIKICSSSMILSLTEKDKSYAYVHISYCYYIAGHSLVALMYLLTKTLKNAHLSSFIRLLQKFKCLGEVLDSVSLPQFCNIEVTTFGRFYN